MEVVEVDSALRVGVRGDGDHAGVIALLEVGKEQDYLQDEDTLILLLSGGDEPAQQKDIEKAHELADQRHEGQGRRRASHDDEREVQAYPGPTSSRNPRVPC